jgi:hypothetical protein
MKNIPRALSFLEDSMTRALALVVFSAVAAMSAPPLTRVQDTLYKADGRRFEGVLQVDWKSFRAVDGTEVPQNSITVAIVGGHISVELVPTTNAQRPMYYTVRYIAEGRTQFTETWAVPQTSATLRVNDVRTSGPLAGAIVAPPPSIDIQSISGLRTELDLRPARGATWAWVSRRSAIIGATGAIESAVGNDSDCVRVDGSSGPCGIGPSRFVDADTPKGDIDGVNTGFVLSAAPDPASSLTLYRNGVLQRNFTISGSTVTFAPGSAPLAGDLLTAYYRLDGNAITPTIYADLEVPVGALDGVNRDFTLSGIPLPAASLRVYRNGLLQKVGEDYTIAVDRITFLAAATPQAGDILQATFRK